jgi:hypothetical protein
VEGHEARVVFLPVHVLVGFLSVVAGSRRLGSGSFLLHQRVELRHWRNGRRGAERHGRSWRARGSEAGQGCALESARLGLEARGGPRSATAQDKQTRGPGQCDCGVRGVCLAQVEGFWYLRDERRRRWGSAYAWPRGLGTWVRMSPGFLGHTVRLRGACMASDMRLLSGTRRGMHGDAEFDSVEFAGPWHATRHEGLEVPSLGSTRLHKPTSRAARSGAGHFCWTRHCRGARYGSGRGHAGAGDRLSRSVFGCADRAENLHRGVSFVAPLTFRNPVPS